MENNLKLDIHYFKRYIFVFAIVVYSIVAVNSIGYHQEDEHYQIVGFAEYKLGNTNEISWEFNRKIRSTVQPLICMGIFSFFRAFGITNPFTLTLILRLLTAVIAVIVIFFFASSSLKIISKKYHIGFLFACFFTWFLPYINVRFSSETWSGLLFLSCITVIQERQIPTKVSHAALIGLILGAATIFRFQTIILAVSLLSWWIIIGKLPVKAALKISMFLLLTIGLGSLIDCWFYQHFTFTFFNYFNVNVIQDVASSFGRKPWYYLLLLIIKGPIPLFGFLILISIVVLMLLKPSNIYVWCIVPFLIVHMFIPHKELRFLFPIANLSPIVFFLALQQLGKLNLRISNYIFFCLGMVVISINLIALIMISAQSTRKGDTQIAYYIYRNFSTQKVNLITSHEANPFDPQMEFDHSFFKRENTHIEEISSFWSSDFHSHIKTHCVNLLVIRRIENTGIESEKRLGNYNFKLVENTLPEPFLKITEWYEKLNDNTIIDGNTSENQLLLYEQTD